MTQDNSGELRGMNEYREAREELKAAISALKREPGHPRALEHIEKAHEAAEKVVEESYSTVDY